MVLGMCIYELGALVMVSVCVYMFVSSWRCGGDYVCVFVSVGVFV